MSYSEMKWGGFAKIIVDTSTMTVGDTVRVKSVTTGTNYDKQVVTVGTPLIWETDIYKDYVKICMVQTINDTPTEIGGVYRTVDYGQTLFIDILNKNSLQGIQGILNSHTENYALNIGDEVIIKINDGGTPKDWVMQVANIDGTNHAIDFVSKEVWSVSAFTSGTGVYYETASYDSLRQKMLEFYNSIDETDRLFIKDKAKTCKRMGYSTWESFIDKVYPLNYKELTGANLSGTPTEVIEQFPLFITQANRIRKYNNTAINWWTCDGGSSTSNAMAINTTGGGEEQTSSNNNRGVVPCFRLTADS